MSQTVVPIGVIAGSGLQDLTLFEEREEHELDTPFGKPSSPIVTARLAGVPVILVRRHGIGHCIPPTHINVRANVAALKQLGVRTVISLSAVGSLTERAPPGTFVMVDQFIDRTYARIKSFFDVGLVGHVPFGEPVCAHVRGELNAAAVDADIHTMESGTYVVMEGPQFSTRAEADLHRALGAHVIGMTAMPEAKLCREAELCYGLVAMVTDFDCWHPGHNSVTAHMVGEVMLSNAVAVRRLLERVVTRLVRFTGPCPHGCERALDGAIMTATDARNPNVVARLSSVMARVLSLSPA